MFALDWFLALLGGLLIAFAASLVLLFQGRIVGISGMFAALVTPGNADRRWKAFFMLGLLTGGVLLGLINPQSLAYLPERPIAIIALAGLLVGFGARMGNGCTSGHGICGLPRLSLRSFLAVMTFMTTGVLSAVIGAQIWS